MAEADNRTYSPRLMADVYRVCRRWTASRELAWDAYQETFLVLVRKHDMLDISTDVTAWACETARRCSKAVVRRERLRAMQPLAEVASRQGSASDAATHEESCRIVREELDKLDSSDRIVLELVDQQGLTHRETAVRIGCSAGTVWSRVEQARTKLRQRLKRRGIIAGALLLFFLLQDSTDAMEPEQTDPRRTEPESKCAYTKGRFQFGQMALATTIMLLLGSIVYGSVEYWSIVKPPSHTKISAEEYQKMTATINEQSGCCTKH